MGNGGRGKGEAAFSLKWPPSAPGLEVVMDERIIPEIPAAESVGIPAELSAEASAEIGSYVDALRQCQQFMSEGRSEEALAALGRLAPPSTNEGKVLWLLIDVMKRAARAMLHTLAGEQEEALAEWRAIRAEAPPGPALDELRKLADSWILVQERGWENLTDDEYGSLFPQVQMFVNQQRALRAGSPAFKSAWEALSRGDEGEYANQMGSAGRAITRAGAENPAVKPILEAMFSSLELVALAMRQQRDFDRFDFDRVSAGAPAIQAKGKTVASSEAATKLQMVPMAWVSDMARFVMSIGQITDRLSRLLRTLLSSGATAKHLQEISEIQGEIRQQQRVLGELEAPAMADPWRKLLLDVAGKLMGLTERLTIEVRPSRRLVLNVAGLASTIAFVTTAAVLLLVGRLTGTDLNTGIVLALSAFFGLVGGFGYGALRFRGFLTSVLFGRAPEEGD